MRLTTLCYLERGERYLMLYRNRKPHDPNAGKWIGIGGGIEPGETPLECLLREAREETNLALIQPRYRGLVHFRSDTAEDEEMYLFTCGEWTGELSDCPEGELHWIDKAELFRLTMWAGDRIFLKLLDEGRSGFDLTLRYSGDRLVGAELDGKSLPVEEP